MASALFTLAKLGVIKASANDPAERFIESPEKALSHDLLNNFSMTSGFYHNSNSLQF